MSPGIEDEVSLVAAEIADHLAAQPRAADSAEGIRRWWLAPRIGERHPAIVQAALERLEATGVARSRRLGDGSVVWGAAPPGGTA
ncbi:hypothetical protein [Falsiroseomonas sp. HW251]|uniref:hypothetical protein n=1 Tax=Falsiroseomonas sp. HW251 TaxID=3390998 RepID=UPI003D31FD6A